MVPAWSYRCLQRADCLGLLMRQSPGSQLVLRKCADGERDREHNGCICCLDEQIHVGIFVAVIVETLRGNNPDQP